MQKASLVTRNNDLHDGSASIDLAMSVADYFNLSQDEASKIATEVATAVSTWRAEGERIGITKRELNRMASAFEHRDSEKAFQPT